MAQSIYKIALVERGYEEQWRGFWVRNENGEKMKSAPVPANSVRQWKS